jgi:probable HAF family extracellular repeat protein
VIAGAVVRSGNFGFFEAMRWNASEGMVNMGAMPSGSSPRAIATGVSSDGSIIVGGSNSTNGTSEAFRWTQSDGFVGLGDLSGGNFSSVASAISRDGTVIVGQGTTIAGTFAFRWTQAGMVSLGDLPGFPNSSYARGVSDDGRIVVGSGNISGGLFGQAFVWEQGVGMKSLLSILLANGINPADDGWTDLTDATGVSADGKTIVGTGFRNGFQQGFVAVLPEPAAVTLIGAGMLVLCTLRRRKN